VATSVAGNYDASLALMGAVVTTGDIDLTGATAPVLTYWQWIQFAPADGGFVTITVDGSTDYTVTPSPAYNGTTPGQPPLIPGSPAWIGDLSSLGWHLVTIDLSAYAGHTINVNWSLEGTAAGSHPGWYIDDILIAD
jgi:bacillopeptidase F (M6 metalloprotease family)